MWGLGDVCSRRERRVEREEEEEEAKHTLKLLQCCKLAISEPLAPDIGNS